MCKRKNENTENKDAPEFYYTSSSTDNKHQSRIKWISRTCSSILTSPPSQRQQSTTSQSDTITKNRQRYTGRTRDASLHSKFIKLIIPPSSHTNSRHSSCLTGFDVANSVRIALFACEKKDTIPTLVTRAEEELQNEEP